MPDVYQHFDLCSSFILMKCKNRFKKNDDINVEEIKVTNSILIS